MRMWQIGVGSTRGPKVNAVKEAAKAIAPLMRDVSVDITGYEVNGGVAHTPTSREELLHGARHRAEVLQQKLLATNQIADFYVGLEGGLDVVTEGSAKRVFLESWAYVSDGRQGHFGCSGSIELPEALAEKVLLQGVELATAIDQFAGAVGIRDGQGAWGVLSANLISRQDSFRLAVIAAFALYNARMYQATSAAGS